MLSYLIHFWTLSGLGKFQSSNRTDSQNETRLTELGISNSHHAGAGFSVSEAAKTGSERLRCDRRMRSLSL